MTGWQILFVDDDPEICSQIKELLEGESTQDYSLTVITKTDFDQALIELESKLYDLVILDVRQGPLDSVPVNEAGVETLRAIQGKRFVPIIFYTGLPNHVRELESPLILVVEKSQTELLSQSVRAVFNTSIPSVNRALMRHLESVERDYMWDFVAKNWAQLSTTPDHTSLAYLLARRFAHSLTVQGVQQLVEDLGGNGQEAGEKLHPMQYYIMPPIFSDNLAGDIFLGSVNEIESYWLLLTPSCDLVSSRVKAEWVLLAKCDSLISQSEYYEWIADHGKVKKLEALINNNRSNHQPDRFFFLPGALTIPDLVIDLQRLFTIDKRDLDTMTRIASLDSPFAEAILARLARYYGRLGTPDLNIELVISRLEPGPVIPASSET